MKEIFINLLILTYASTGIIATAGYWPTIKDLYKKKTASANIPSYIVWTFTNAIAFLYVLILIPDLLLIIVTGLSFVSCALILTLSVRLKMKYQTKTLANIHNLSKNNRSNNTKS